MFLVLKALHNRRNLIFLRYSHIPQFFGLLLISSISKCRPHIYPTLYLGNFGFLAGQHLAPWQAFLWPWLPKITLFGAKHCVFGLNIQFLDKLSRLVNKKNKSLFPTFQLLFGMKSLLDTR